MDGYATISEPPHTYFVRPEWEGRLLPHLRNGFASVQAHEKRAHTDGRVAHFSFPPDGGPGRVIVRRAVRASAAAFMGDLYFGAGRLHRELQACATANRHGLAVPEIVAARLTRVGFFFYRYLLVVREVEGASNLLGLARKADPATKHLVARRLGEEVRKMHEAGIYHGDLTMKNILVSAPRHDIHFIDFDRSRFESARHAALDEANLSRLNRSVVKLFSDRGAITRTDKFRFLKSYAGSMKAAAEVARRCGGTLWMHRFWWKLTGHAVP